MDNCIVVADDDPIARRVLRSVLEEAGYSVAEARDGQETLEKVRDYDPRLLVLDVAMPKLNGLQVCQHLRQTGILRQVPIVMLSACNELEDIRKGLLIGADRYITKPIEKTEFLQDIQAMLCPV